MNNYLDDTSDFIKDNNYFISNPTIIKDLPFQSTTLGNLNSMRQFNNLNTIQSLNSTLSLENINNLIFSTPLVAKKASEIFD